MGPEYIPDPPDRLDPRAVRVDLRPEARDHDVDDVGLGIEAVVPDVLKDHRLADGPPRVPQEEGEQREFPGLELDARAGERYLAGHQVELYVPRAESGRLRR